MNDYTEPFYKAKYWVGCSTEDARKILFTLEEVEKTFESFCYIAAFDENGIWLDEAKVDFDEYDNPYLNFSY